MWSPTHVQVTVQRAKGLLTKGKNGTNDAFVTIALGKDKYQTSVKEKSIETVEWHEECELQIPKQGNTAEIMLTVLHRNFIGVDEFLGVINIPLAEFDVYERPRNRWYILKSKPGKEKNKPRGELEVKVAFIVKAGSLTDLSKKEKHKSSLGQLSVMAQSVGGSLLSIGSLEKRGGLKKLARSIGNKVSRKPSHRHHSDSDDKNGINSSGFNTLPRERRSQQVVGDADPGVISEGESEDDFTFDDLSHKSSASSLANQANNTNTSVAGSLENLAGGEFLRRNSGTSSLKSRMSAQAEKAKTLDEWEEKLCGKGKDAYGTNIDAPKRSWETSKTVLSSQPEEDEPKEETRANNDSPTVENNFPTVGSVESLKKRENGDSVDTEKKEEEKEKSKLGKRFKNFRRGSKQVELMSDNNNSTLGALVQASASYERIIIGGENDGMSASKNSSRLPGEVLQKYEGKSREDLIEMIHNLQSTVDHQNLRMKDLEDYLDNLLVRVMETTPLILQNPYVTCKATATIRNYLQSQTLLHKYTTNG